MRIGVFFLSILSSILSHARTEITPQDLSVYWNGLNQNLITVKQLDQLSYGDNGEIRKWARFAWFEGLDKYSAETDRGEIGVDFRGYDVSWYTNHFWIDYASMGISYSYQETGQDEYESSEYARIQLGTRFELFNQILISIGGVVDQQPEISEAGEFVLDKSIDQRRYLLALSWQGLKFNTEQGADSGQVKPSLTYEFDAFEDFSLGLAYQGQGLADDDVTATSDLATRLVSIDMSYRPEAWEYVFKADERLLNDGARNREYYLTFEHNRYARRGLQLSYYDYETSYRDSNIGAIMYLAFEMNRGVFVNASLAYNHAHPGSVFIPDQATAAAGMQVNF